MTEHGIAVRRVGRTAVWTLDRPERMNALSRATLRQLGLLAREAAQDDELLTVIITGGGTRAFCAGADLKERRDMTEQEVRDALPLYREAFGAIERIPCPTIAAINGVAFGGGLELALACDMRIMARTTQVGLTETSLGIIPGAGGTQRLTHLVGTAKAAELILLAKRLSADEALALGIVNALADDAKAEAEDWATRLSGGAPIAIRAAIEAVRAGGKVSLEEGLTTERACYERTLRSEDRVEALRAFAEKRPPSFQGR